MRRRIGFRGEERCYKYAAETPKQKLLTGLGLFLQHAAINIPPLQG